MALNDFEISLEQAEGNGLLEVLLTGELTIENSQSIHNYLLDNAFHKEKIKIKIYSPANIDLCFIQLLMSFMESRNKIEKITYLDLNIDDSLMELLSKTGITEKISSLQNEGS